MRELFEDKNYKSSLDFYDSIIVCEDSLHDDGTIWIEMTSCELGGDGLGAELAAGGC